MRESKLTNQIIKQVLEEIDIQAVYELPHGMDIVIGTVEETGMQYAGKAINLEEVLSQAITQAVEEAEKKQLEKIIAYMEVVSAKYHLSHHDRKPSYGSGQANGFRDAVSELKTLDKLTK